MNVLKKFAIAAVSLVALGAMTITAFAAPAYATPAEAAAALTGKSVEEVTAKHNENHITYGKIASDAGKLTEFKTAMLDIRKDALDKKVADGTMTQARADEILTAIKENQATCDGTGAKKIGACYGLGLGNSGSCDGTRQGSCGFGRGRANGTRGSGCGGTCSAE